MPATHSLVILIAAMSFVSPSLRADDTNSKDKLIEMKTEDQKTKTQKFCSKANAEDAEKKCQAWLSSQKTSLGARLLTGDCTSGDQTSDSTCFFKSEGEVVYILNKSSSVYEIK